MSSYKALRSFVGWFLLLYFLGGVAASRVPRRILPHGEVFPVFSWFLFAKVPQHAERFGLRIHQSEGIDLDPPLFFEEAIGIVHHPHDVTAQRIIQRLGKAEQRGKQAAVQRMRALLEEIYLPPGTRYELVNVISDPLHRWRTGEREVERIRMFTAPEKGQ